MIDWKDPKAKISKYFTVKDACYLPSWGVYHYPTAIEQWSISSTALSMDQVRTLLGKPITVHCWLRPLKADCGPPNAKVIASPAKAKALTERNYNAFIGGAPNSAHTMGIAVDWDCGEDCDKTRQFLIPKLERLGARMEDLEGSSWVHLDWAPVKTKRFFKP